MMEIGLTQDRVALVDDEDFEYLNQFRWCALKVKNTFYAVRNSVGANGKRMTVLMHRIINETPDGLEVDHIDSNGLNNQKNNLRNCTHAQNLRNQKKNKNNTSGFKGVFWKKDKKKWQASLRVNNKDLHVGYYKDKINAAYAYNDAAIKYYGEFAKINNTSEVNK